jgi:drug/metabolite transporter (DMT)-like permease
MVTAAFSFVVGLRYIPLADIVAVTFLTPVVITILAPLTLGERVGWHRWCAVAVGFAGVLVIARPAGGSLSIAFLLPLITVVANGVRDIITRRMSTTERSTATVAFTTVIVILVGLATVPFAWVTPNLVDLGIIAVGGLLFGTAHFLYIEAFRMAEATVVAPFRYFNLVWATGFGFLLFGTLPTTSFYAGAVLIVGSGLYIMYRDAFPR